MFWRYAKALSKAARNRPDLEWAYHLGLMTQVTIVAFAAGGAFLSLIIFDVPYYLMMAMVVIRQLVADELKKPGPQQAVVPPWHAYGTTSSPQAATPKTDW
jgi:hypothetical protein